MDLVRRVFLRFAFSTSPAVARQAVQRLEKATKALAHMPPEGDETFKVYSEVVDAYRDLTYFLDKFLDRDAQADLKQHTKHLTIMSRHPFIIEDAIEAGGPDLFKQAVKEVVPLVEAFEEASVLASYQKDKSTPPGR